MIKAMPNGYKVRGRVLIPNGVGPRKAYLLRPGYLANPVTTFWHRNGAVTALLPYLLKTAYNPSHFSYRETFKRGDFRYSVWPSVATYKLTSYSSYGGYPLYYVTADNCVLCADCATKQVTTRGCDWPRVIDVDTHMEGSALSCDNCSAEIESAYGDPDEDNEE